MKKTEWQLGSDLIEFKRRYFGVFARFELSRNGVHIASGKVSKMPTVDIPFGREKSRTATLRFDHQLGQSPLFRPMVFVDGREIPTTEQSPDYKCQNCGEALFELDNFCENCGEKTPSISDCKEAHMKTVSRTATLMRVLAGLFVIVGIGVFLANADITQQALDNLGQYEDSAVLILSDGSSAIAGEMRRQVLWERWGALASNIVLALVFLGLAQLSKSKPVGAIIAALGIYLSMLVANAILVPESLFEGIILKAFIIFALFRGLKAAFNVKNAERRQAMKRGTP